jgi:hypothetical protein
MINEPDKDGKAAIVKTVEKKPQRVFVIRTR